VIRCGAARDGFLSLGNGFADSLLIYESRKAKGIRCI
jgi:hypothetical protein